MLFREVLDIFEIIDSPKACGKDIVQLFKPYDANVKVEKVQGEKGYTEFVQILIKGRNGKSVNSKKNIESKNAKTFGIVGRLGGVGARPSRIGVVSDADGAIAALAAALKLAKMKTLGDELNGDVLISTHICPNAPTLPHKPVDFMSSPVDIGVMNKYEVHEDMDCIFSIDTTKGNKIINHKGISISPTVKEGYILKVSDDLVRILESSTGELAHVFPISIQDITPYGNDLYHINSIMQPAVATDKAVVGVAITTKTAVAGCATGASHEVDIANAANFVIEVAKEYTLGNFEIYSEEEFEMLQNKYGSMKRFQTLGE